jgi:hypothetical protein
MARLTTCGGPDEFGAADNTFPRMLEAAFRNDQDGDTFDANGPADGGLITNTDYNVSGMSLMRTRASFQPDRRSDCQQPSGICRGIRPRPGRRPGHTDDVLKDGTKSSPAPADGST